MPGLGWVAALIVGGLAGWFADKFADSGLGQAANVVLGVFGAMLLNFIVMSLLPDNHGGWLGQLVAGAVGAGVLLFAAKTLRSKS